MLEHLKKVSVPEALAPAKRILVVGAAGSGKTTLLKWVAVRAANQDFAGHEELLPWQDKVPFFLRLRDFAQKPLPSFDMIPIQTRGVTELAGRLPQSWTDAQLRAGRALILIDGLDEVNQAKREEAYGWLERMISIYPNSVYIVSTRPNTVMDEATAARLTRADFVHLNLQDMDQEAITNFIDHWHMAMADERCLLPQNQKDELPELVKKLQSDLKRQPKLRELARNPLLCALLCALHQARRSNLPNDRIQLYGACIDMLLEGRDVERGVDVSDYSLVLTLREKIRLLANLAYWMMRNNVPVISHAEAIQQLTLGNLDGETILRLLLDRSGLLQTQTVNEFDFVHRTFQEYLAAQDIVFKDDIRAACRHARESEWQETIRLVAGVASTETAQKRLLQRLLEMAENQPSQEQRRRLHLLAWECFSMMAVPTSELYNLAAAHVAGLIRRVKSEKNKDIKQTLILVSSPVMVEVGEPVVSDGELFWTEERTHINNLLPLTKFTKLQTLCLSGAPINDLAPLTSLTRLQILYVDQTSVANLTPLANLIKLQILHLAETPVTDLRPLTSLVNLRVLSLIQTNITDLTPLAGLISLQKFHLQRTAITDLSPLANLIGLQVLNLGGTTITDLWSLASLTHLQRLYLWETAVADLVPLAKLTELLELSLRGTAITDLAPLADLSKLQVLDLKKTAVTNLTPLTNLTDLKVLDLRETAVTDFTPLLLLPEFKAIWVTDDALLPSSLQERIDVNAPEEPYMHPSHLRA